MENEFLRLEFDHQGRLTRICDRTHQREVLAPEAIGNQFQLFEDKPHNFDAWDVDFFYQDKMLQVDGTAHGGVLPPTARQIWLEGEGVVVENIKKAEDDDGIIVRLYEAHGGRCEATLATILPVRVRAAYETDLMERPEKRLPLRSGRVRLAFTPFQIRTIKLATR